jgi:hypothetical protein
LPKNKTHLFYVLVGGGGGGPPPPPPQPAALVPAAHNADKSKKTGEMTGGPKEGSLSNKNGGSYSVVMVQGSERCPKT